MNVYRDVVNYSYYCENTALSLNLQTFSVSFHTISFPFIKYKANLLVCFIGQTIIF